MCRCNVYKEVRAEAEMNDSASVSMGTSDVGGCGTVRLYVSVCVAATCIPEFCIHDMTCFSQSLANYLMMEHGGSEVSRGDRKQV